LYKTGKLLWVVFCGKKKILTAGNWERVRSGLERSKQGNIFLPQGIGKGGKAFPCLFNTVFDFTTSKIESTSVFHKRKT